MYDIKACETAKPATISSNIFAAHDRLGSLDGRFQALADRLNSVLTPQPPTPEAGGVIARLMPTRSDLNTSSAGLIERIEAMETRIENLLTRLEV
jgi:hypothetical protein